MSRRGQGRASLPVREGRLTARDSATNSGRSSSGRPITSQSKVARRFFALILLAGLVACGGGSGDSEAPGTAFGIALQPLVHPPLDGVEERTATQISGERERLDEALGTADDAPALASAYGRMGRAYHAYSLLDPALIAYRNARALEPDAALWAELEGRALARLGRLQEGRLALESAAARQPSGALLLHLGELLLDHGEASAALRRFEEAGGNGEAFLAASRFGLGRALLRLDQAEAAVTALEEARGLAPEAGVVNYQLALAYRRLGRRDAAEAALARPSQGEVSFPDPVADGIAALQRGLGASMRRGGEALMQGRLDEAIGAFERAVSADPTYGEAYRNLALAQLRAGRPGDAVATLDRASRALPGDAGVALDRGNALLAAGDAQRAAEAFRKALELEPSLASARFNLANTLIRLDRWDAAMEELDTLLVAEPKHYRARYLRAMGLHRTGRAGEAIRRLRTLIAEDPTAFAPRQGLASIRLQSRDPNAAAAVYRSLLSAGPSPADAVAAHQQLATIEAGRERLEVAAGHYQSALDLEPDNQAALLGLAVLEARLDRPASALTRFERVLAVRPEAVEAIRGRAAALVALGRVDEAHAALESALSRAPADPALQDAVARLLAASPTPETRDAARALQLAQQALTVRPSADYAETLAMALAASGRHREASLGLRRLLSQPNLQISAAQRARLEGRIQRYEQGADPVWTGF